MRYPPDMDPDCIQLCEVLNEIAGITTVESCCGHGRIPFVVFFNCATISALAPIVQATYSSAWEVRARWHNGFQEHVSFVLEGPVGARDMPGGADDFADWVRENTTDEMRSAPCRGVVKFFNIERGYGFIVRDDGLEIFLHRSFMAPNAIPPHEGQRATFGVRNSEKGLRAVNPTFED